jgi:4-diphosphocytidyl-2-C-methyl-D-erythritol kinase
MVLDPLGFLMINEFAPAKLNLYLHITGRRADGYHDLDSLVAFADIGDEIELWAADHFSFVVQGPQAASLSGEDHAGNLVVKAARSLAELTGNDLKVAIKLTKNLPVASGIGGGSSDAAAVLRALAIHWRLAPDDAHILEAAAQHGQDVPVCVKIENNYITASGVLPAPQLPRVACVLVNPNAGLPTPTVYREYREGGDAFSPLSRLQQIPLTTAELVTALKERRNDLYAPACRLIPAIVTIIEAMKMTKNCLLARMSGSGATCFGLYADDIAAQAAAAQLRATHPDWWIEAGAINAQN